jgi:hypothetical protein
LVKKLIELLKQLNELLEEVDKTTKKFQKFLGTLETCFIRIISLVGWIAILMYILKG